MIGLIPLSAFRSRCVASARPALRDPESGKRKATWPAARTRRACRNWPKLRFGVEASTRLRDFAFRRLSARGFKRGAFQRPLSLRVTFRTAQNSGATFPLSAFPSAAYRFRNSDLCFWCDPYVRQPTFRWRLRNGGFDGGSGKS